MDGNYVSHISKPHYLEQPKYPAITSSQQDIKYKCSNDVCRVYVGYFSLMVNIDDQILDDFDVQFSGKDINKFKIYPEVIKARKGEEQPEKVRIGANYDTTPGLYILQTR